MKRYIIIFVVLVAFFIGLAYVMVGNAQESVELESEVVSEASGEYTKIKDRTKIELCVPIAPLLSGCTEYSQGQYKQLKKDMLAKVSYSWQELYLLNAMLKLELTEKTHLNLKNATLKEIKKAVLTEEE